MLRRTSALLAAAATLVSTGLAAAPLPAATAAGSRAAALECRVTVTGVLPDGRLLSRDLHDARETQAKTSQRALPFRPTSLGVAGYEGSQGVFRVWYVATADAGRPRLVQVDDRLEEPRLRTTTTRLATSGFTPRLFASGTAGPHVLALEGSVLRQYRYRATDRGLEVVNGRVALRGMDGLATLSWYSRQELGGALQDIYYATTARGALKQLRVPVKNPAAARILTVKRTGFAGFSGLSLGHCGAGTSTAVIVGVDRRRNRARWFTLSEQRRPARVNLVDRGAAAPGKNWRLRATV